ncbi:GIN domain-containing protein [Tropicimonas marinistellae]|uniref:GIN domain-containing protein n=1 Tax=Tropicimonas marinistellae TaxID=1739787 RepID=UPI00082EF8DC|nr:DUF2807 domain-containing protein [Tropicimonas marinistellae]
MKPILLVSTIALATATPLLAADKSYDFEGFTKVVVRGAVDVDIRSGDTYGVDLDVSRRSLLRRLDIRQSGDTLIIERRKGASFFLMGMADHYEVTVSMPELEEVAAVASADVDVAGVRAASVSAKASSGASLDLHGVDVQSAVLKASSGAEITAEGVCGTLTARASSGAEIEASDLVCSQITVKASSGSDMEAHATDAAQAVASSGGDIRLHGTATDQDLRESSGGDVRVAG